MENNFKPLVPYMPLKPMLANAYVPYQMNCEKFDASEGLDKGTMFKCLYSPYQGNLKGGDIVCK